MRLTTTILTGVIVFGLTSNAAQAYLITHSTDGVLFYDDMEGGTFAAEVGNWGSGNTHPTSGLPIDAVREMVTGAETGGPAGAFAGNDYGKISRPEGQQVLAEAILDHSVSSGTLTLETHYWLDIVAQEIGTVDNRVGFDTDPTQAQTYLWNWDGAPVTNWRNTTNYASYPDTGAPVLPGQWNTLKMEVNLDDDTVQVWVTSVATNNLDEAVTRVALRIGDSSGSAFYLDAVPEPTTGTICIAGLLMLFGCCRRRRAG